MEQQNSASKYDAPVKLASTTAPTTSAFNYQQPPSSSFNPGLYSTNLNMSLKDTLS
jgi:hypothetical protein